MIRWCLRHFDCMLLVFSSGLTRLATHILRHVSVFVIQEINFLSCARSLMYLRTSQGLSRKLKQSFRVCFRLMTRAGFAMIQLCQRRRKPKPKHKHKHKIGIQRQITVTGVHAQCNLHQSMKRSLGTIFVKIKNCTIQVVGSKSNLTGKIS